MPDAGHYPNGGSTKEMATKKSQLKNKKSDGVHRTAVDMAPGGQIGWFDIFNKAAMSAAITTANDMHCMNSRIIGMDRQLLPAQHPQGSLDKAQSE